ncbi:MAG TPA: hypothetical protein VJN50_04520 [Actinomycetota bacterium]|nr:hypothetical protein [Actinomycetota bacterium]
MKRELAAVVAFALLAGACEREAEEAPVPPVRETTSPPPTGPGTAAAALARLCPAPTGGAPREVEPRRVPPSIREVVRDVEDARGLELLEPVAVDVVTRERLAELLHRESERSLPEGFLERKSLAWATISALPSGTSIKQAVQEFTEGQVIGFYVPESGKLVFIGTEDLDPVAYVTLAHELTHAIEDQHFDLDRLDDLDEECRDEAVSAAIAVVEGSAQLYSIRAAQQNLTPEEILSIAGIDVPSFGDVPPFIVQLELWPYTAGLGFATVASASGELDGALEEFPVSTEQIIHPERWPNDAPQALDVTDLGPELGQGFEDLDVQEVGEQWLQILLGLRLDAEEAREAAAGWDGGLYRAWSDGDAVAVLMETVWDRPEDASQFAEAIEDWLGEGDRPGFVELLASRVTVGFASDGATLEALRTAA